MIEYWNIKEHYTSMMTMIANSMMDRYPNIIFVQSVYAKLMQYMVTKFTVDVINMVASEHGKKSRVGILNRYCRLTMTRNIKRKKIKASSSSKSSTNSSTRSSTTSESD